MTEAGAWRYLRAAVGDRWYARRIEDRLAAGTPDVFYAVPGRCCGWLELKHRPAWPARAATPLRLGLTAEQRRVLLDLRAAGVPAWVYLRVGRDHLLLHPARAVDAPQDELLASAAWDNADRLWDVAGFLDALTQPTE